MASVLRIKDENGNWIDVPCIVGRSAYQIAVDNGFEGTEAEWLESLKGRGITDADLDRVREEIEATHAHAGVPATGVLLEDKAFSGNVFAEEWEVLSPTFIERSIPMQKIDLAQYPYFKVAWNGTEMQVKNTDSESVNLIFTLPETSTEVTLWIYPAGFGEQYILYLCQFNQQGVAAEMATFTITPATGAYESYIKQLDPIFIPDYVSKTYVDGIRTHYAKPIYGEKTVIDLSDAVEFGENEWSSTHYPSPIALEDGKQYAVVWNGEIQICKAEVSEEHTPPVVFIHNDKFNKGEEGGFSFAMTTEVNVLDIFFYGEAESCEVMPCTEEVKQLDVKFIPDYVSKTEVEETVGNIESALDSIIAMQNALIGGDSV